ncbi:hypothetical protein COC69_23985 [Bacillus cereus]|uniref:Uncharacterized protein n=2 Tax=Bacillus cereus TaxID=1396 RepID=A0A9X7CJP2_BACCE|nr:hypothetical protein COC69_23985 [Bacillus cereus]
MLGISSEDDDDGNHASERQENRNEPDVQQKGNTSGVASEKQMNMIHAKIASIATVAQEDKETVTKGLKKQLGIQSLSGINWQLASQAITVLKGWEQKYGGGK